MGKNMEEQLEIRVGSLDEDIVGVVTDALQPSSVEQWPRARTIDPVTILAVTGNVVALINGLLTLREKLEALRKASGAKAPVEVTITTEGGSSVRLDTADRAKLEVLLRAS